MVISRIATDPLATRQKLLCSGASVSDSAEENPSHADNSSAALALFVGRGPTRRHGKKIGDVKKRVLADLQLSGAGLVASLCRHVTTCSSCCLEGPRSIRNERTRVFPSWAAREASRQTQQQQKKPDNGRQQVGGFCSSGMPLDSLDSLSLDSLNSSLTLPLT